MRVEAVEILPIESERLPRDVVSRVGFPHAPVRLFDRKLICRRLVCGWRCQKPFDVPHAEEDFRVRLAHTSTHDFPMVFGNLGRNSCEDDIGKTRASHACCPQKRRIKNIPDFFKHRLGSVYFVPTTQDKLEVIVGKEKMESLYMNANLLGLINELKLYERCKGFKFFVHEGSCDGENYKLYPIRIQKQNIPKELYQQHPEAFLSNDAPIELQKAFYSRQLTTEMILAHPEYQPYLKGKDLQLLYEFMHVRIYEHGNKSTIYRSSRGENLIKIIQTEFKEDALQTMLDYGKYLESLYKLNNLYGFELIEGYTKDDILNNMDKAIYQGIIKNGFKYDDKIAGHFKGNYPTLFLDDNVDQAIKDKFYKREFTIQDFNDNPDLIDIFGETNIICGFDENISWLIPVIKGENNKRNNLIRLKVFSVRKKK